MNIWNDFKVEDLNPPQIYKVAIKTQFISVLFIPQYNILIAGETKGNLFLFDFTPLDGEVMNYQQLKAHKNERVLSITYDEVRNMVYSTSKDNYINAYSIDENKHIQKISSIKEEDLNLIYDIHNY